MNKYKEEILKKLLKNNKLPSNTPLTEITLATISYLSKLKPNLSKENPLSCKEIICLILLAIGNNPERCADLLGITPHSVMTYEKRIRKKLGARNRTHAFYLAFIHRYILLLEE